MVAKEFSASFYILTKITDLLQRKSSSKVAGFFFESTTVRNTKNKMGLMQKEVFGSVSPIAAFEILDKALSTTNDSEFCYLQLSSRYTIPILQKPKETTLFTKLFLWVSIYNSIRISSISLKISFVVHPCLSG